MKAPKNILLLFTFVLLWKDAFAYIDPGTGSYVFQVLLALMASGLFAVKMFWHKIKFFKKTPSEGTDDE